MKKILVIDDMHGIANLIQSILSEHGYDVDVAYDGKEGIKTIEKGHFDLVLTDILMPEQDGFDVVTYLETLDKDIAVIAMTGGGVTISAPVALAALESKVDATLKKPVSKEELLDCVSKVFADR